MSKEAIHIFWFRRDLRLEDNAGLAAALSAGIPVLPIFIFDKNILDKLPKNDARVSFIYDTLASLNLELKNSAASGLARYYGDPVKIFEELTKTYSVQGVFTNRDYEPYGLDRDQTIAKGLTAKGISFNTYKDQVIFERDEIVKNDGLPYVVYTPFKNKWKEHFRANVHLNTHTSNSLLSNCILATELPSITLEAMGFEPATIKVPPFQVTPELIANYEDTRNFPAIDHGTSRLGPHLRFGTVSVRQMVGEAIKQKNEVFWSELIWREFFMQILFHFPHTTNRSFRPKYDRIEWRNDPSEFQKWCDGQTGYAFVDAGMRELNTTGFMHNRVRMLVASFLCKHLLIDWRLGEAYFAEKLLDFDLSANVGNWQWAAGSGVDAAPYFRIFNPMTQIDKFDKQKEYISKWVPELQELTYPPMMVDHKVARERCLRTYKAAMS
ncbi:MAG: deoxyribodipyrimidine photo-lyase [Flavobacteriales bacterium]